MKTMLMILCLQSLSVKAYSDENIKWAHGPFWKAPQSLDFQRKMKVLDPELINSCSVYNKFIEAYKKSDKTPSLARMIDDFRKEGLANQLSFKGLFEVLDVPFDRILENELRVEEDLSNEILPMYNQSKSFTGINLNNSRNYEVVASEGSMVGFSRKLGLTDSSATLTTNRQGKLVIEVNGADLGCDLLNKKVILKAKIPSYVRITEEASQEMNNFYNFKLAPQVNELLAKSETSSVKAARLGYRIGRLLEDKNEGKFDDALIEGQMMNLMDLLFIPKTLTPSLIFLTQEKNKKVIDFRSSVNGDAATFILGL